jgi:hypothetical protein
VLAPLNLVWVAQLLGLAALTSCLTLDGSLQRGAATTAAYVLAVTVLGPGARLDGRRAAPDAGRDAARRAAGVLALVGVVVAVRTGTAAPCSSCRPGPSSTGSSPAATATCSAGAPSPRPAGDRRRRLVGGALACRWSLLRPGEPVSRRVARPVRRRTAGAAPLRELVAVDRASVWRAPALRRGAVVLAVLPGLLAAGAALPWSSLVVLPGLVAAGAALLFGVNAFSLDASGSLWLASLPSDPALLLRSKAVVLTETVLGRSWCVGRRLGPQPRRADAGGAHGDRVVRPAVHRGGRGAGAARLAAPAVPRGPARTARRRRPAGALALASLRLALPTTVVAVSLGTAAATGQWWLPPALALRRSGSAPCRRSGRHAVERSRPPVVRRPQRRERLNRPRRSCE